MKYLNKLLILTIILSLPIQQSGAQDISEKNLKKHIYYLASDKLEGRAPGTRGETLACEYLEQQFETIGLPPKGEEGYRQTFHYNPMPTAHTLQEDSSDMITGTNVIAWLDNGADKTVVIGAHYDHLGYGKEKKSLDANRGKVIHNGADDNASGTAGVLELARYLSGNGVRENSNFLFICFSAEEDGLIGSKYFTANPTIDLSTVNYMINMDMIGRLNKDTHKLTVHGLGTSPSFFSELPADTTGLHILEDSSGIGASDHTSFYLKDIPVLFFFTGTHADYHKSTDDANKINYAGEKRVLEYITDYIQNLDDEEKLAFTPVKFKPQQRANFKVTLGIMPGYAYEGKGVPVDAVSPDRPASRAGIVAGDIIVGVDTVEVNNIYDYMKCLGMFEKGDSARVKVLRNKEEVELDVIF